LKLSPQHRTSNIREHFFALYIVHFKKVHYLGYYQCDNQSSQVAVDLVSN